MADLLGTTLAELKRDIDDGVLGQRVSKEELIAPAIIVQLPRMHGIKRGLLSPRQLPQQIPRWERREGN